MLTVSDAALEKFGETIASMQNSQDDESCLRMVRSEESGLALTLEPPHTDDTTFDFKGRTVLAVPSEFADFCDDKQLDLDSDGNLTLA
ncbi:MAG: hypothetical protein U5K76_10020 [Woeseiaceae bacterium]|nr:hypothetical protein [Woeseiaceae bacterium]